MMTNNKFMVALAVMIMFFLCVLGLCVLYAACFVPAWAEAIMMLVMAVCVLYLEYKILKGDA